jgi:nucleotide-binding universal stress UspA family protein
MQRVNIATILCPIDFSEFSRDALNHAVALANWYRAKLTLIHVIDIPQVPLDALSGGAGAFTPPLDLDRAKVADDVRDFARPAIGPADISMDVLITFGGPVTEIQRHAEQIHADVVVVGTHGRSGFQRFVLGSVTERLLRTIVVPLLIVPPPVMKPKTVVYDTILCPIDFSDESMRALDYALSLAQETDARIILLHVLEALLDEVTPRTRNAAVLEYLRELEQDASARLMAAVPDEARTWSHPVERIVRGRAYREVLAIAEAERASLIVMGVRGRAALNRLIFGSTTEHVIREARCPVLTLHSEVAPRA